MKSYAFLTFLLVVSGTAFADTLTVPDQYASIQEAINAASGGDTVIVNPGRYVENIDFNGKAITVQSAFGPHLTVIDGAQLGRVAVFDSGETPDAVLSGFTVTNGTGGICCLRGSSPTIYGNVISGNHGPSGGGIDCVDSSPVIMSNTIIGNSSSSHGGGIHCNNSHPAVANNIIAANSTVYGGGGISCESSGPDILNNTIVHNSAEMGGGICGYNCISSITNTILWDNTATYGPECYFDGTSSCTVSFCNIMGGWPGTGNIDIDPLFVASVDHDYHLTSNSPCRDSGDSSAAALPAADFEGDPRTAAGSADMGADEFYYHLYHAGGTAPGAPVAVKFIGEPRMPVRLLAAGEILDTPFPTPYGGLWLAPSSLKLLYTGEISRSGVLVYNSVIPATWHPGDTHPFQALVGPWGGTATRLTNPMVLGVY
jgi:hypothetical protein